MKIYESLSVELAYQNLGSTWLMILRGTKNDIELTFNGLYNLRATDGSLTYQNEAKTMATFWSSKEKMKRFFQNKYSFANGNAQKVEIDLFSNQKLEQLKQNQEIFKTFTSNNICSYGKGIINAERPDDDFRDATWKFQTNVKTEKVEESVEE